jgi:hypothetical protein
MSLVRPSSNTQDIYSEYRQYISLRCTWNLESRLLRFHLRRMWILLLLRVPPSMILSRFGRDEFREVAAGGMGYDNQKQISELDILQCAHRCILP